jgi:hypothetical protein
MKFECERCCYETDKISHLKRHLSRKIICEDINECGITVNNLLKSLEKDTTDYKFKCTVCDLKFKSNSGKCKHEIKCKFDKILKENNNLKTALEKQQQDNNLFKNEFKELKELIIQKNIQQNNIAIENNQQNNIAIENNITINVLGSENLSHIKPESMLECINGHTDGIIKLIKMFFLDKNHPENRNILYHDENNYKILELKFMTYNCKIISKHGEYYWIVKNKDLVVIENILPRIQTYLSNFINEDIERAERNVNMNNFVTNVVHPYEWTMDLKEEDDIDMASDEALEKHRKETIPKIVYNIDQELKEII